MHDRRVALALLIAGTLLLAGHRSAEATRPARFAPPGVLIIPTTVTAGHAVQLLVIGPVPRRTAAVVIAFRSAHHAWSGLARWSDGCGCYVANVSILPKAHGLERAQVTARVRLRTGRVLVYHAAFFIRGLAAPRAG